MSPTTTAADPRRSTTGTSPATIASIASIVAAAAFAVEGVIAVVHHTGDQNWDAASQVLDLSFALGCVALIIALPILGRVLAVGRVGRIGVLVAQVGFTAMTVESIVSSIHDGNTLGGVFFGGLLLTLLGLLVFGIDAIRTGRPRWAAPLPFLGMIVAIAGGDHGGSIVLGAVWVVLGVLLVRPRP